MLGAPGLEILFLLKAARVLRLQKRRFTLGELSGRETGLHRVVVMRRHGIELVIVATCALKRVRKKGLADRICYIIEEALPSDFGDLHSGEFPGPHSEKTDGDELFRIVRRKFIAGDLLHNELIEWFVCVETSHDIIAEAPGIAALVVIRKAAAVCIAHDIQPMTSHAFAVVGRFE